MYRLKTETSKKHTSVNLVLRRKISNEKPGLQALQNTFWTEWARWVRITNLEWCACVALQTRNLASQKAILPKCIQNSNYLVFSSRLTSQLAAATSAFCDWLLFGWAKKEGWRCSDTSWSKLLSRGPFPKHPSGPRVIQHDPQGIGRGLKFSVLLTTPHPDFLKWVHCGLADLDYLEQGGGSVTPHPGNGKSTWEGKLSKLRCVLTTRSENSDEFLSLT